MFFFNKLRVVVIKRPTVLWFKGIKNKPCLPLKYFLKMFYLRFLYNYNFKSQLSRTIFRIKKKGQYINSVTQLMWIKTINDDNNNNTKLMSNLRH